MSPSNHAPAEAQSAAAARDPSTAARPDVEMRPGSGYGLGLKDAVLSGWFQNDADELFRGIHVGPGDVVVDVGCGDSGNGFYCAQRGAHVIAVDIDPKVLAVVKARIAQIDPELCTTHLSDANPLPLADATATRVICTEVLEHVEEPDELLAELFRIGKPGARYLLSVPGSLSENMQRHVAPPQYFKRPNHIRIIDRQQFAQMVTRSGLIIEEQTQHGFFWSVWWALYWACEVDLSNPSHPVLDHWTEAWEGVLKLPRGHELKQQLDAFMPKSQIIIASKP
ncbi:MAG TPA: class I SAM-dependent methyltransferase [Rhodanobacter sp.]|nr:class I SAM-dependent methyltransferase [Rhodanobacter sp.]